MSSSPKGRLLKPAKEGQPSQTQPVSKKRKPGGRISAACEACKKRKTKCTGGPPPCQLCESLGTECVIDLSLDMRRRAALQRTIDESKTYQDTLNGLVECIRDGASQPLDQLFDYIRTGASLQAIGSAIQQMLQTLHDRDEGIAQFLEDDLGQSPDEGIIDNFVIDTSIRSHPHLTDGEIGTPGDEEEYQSPQSGTKGKEKEQEATSHGIGQFISTMGAATSNPEAEALLKHLLTVEGDLRAVIRKTLSNKQQLFPSSATEPSAFPSGYSELKERAKWHPALQLRPAAILTHQTPAKIASFNEFSSTGTSASSESMPGNTRDAARYDSDSTNQHSTNDSNVPLPQPPIQYPSEPYLEMAGMPSAGSFISNKSALCVAQVGGSTRLRVPIHLVEPLIIPDESFLSRVYSDYYRGAKQMLVNGLPLSEVLGSGEEMIVDLFQQQRTAGDKFDCGSWACETSRSLVEIDEYVRLAMALFLAAMMRWLLVPTIENYSRLPEMMKPTASQLVIPHIAAIELIPIPALRDAAIMRLRDWLTPLIESNLTVNWPHSMEEAIEKSPTSGSLRLTTQFIQHVTTYQNWSVGSNFLKAFPDMLGRIRIQES